MSEPRQERLQRLFSKACDLADDDLTHFLERECADDPELARELAELLEEDRAGHEELERPASEHLRAGAVGRPERIGGYRILRHLGTGGMGVVYEAEQHRPRRRVALKLLQPGLATESLLRRFEHESEVLGWLDHPGIARVFEAGTADTGHGPQPFFAMELVEGAPLTTYAERAEFDVAGRLELLAKVCDAVHHAHQKGVVHRDLKPGNILVDAAGEPRILDFGVARITDADLEVTTRRTHAGEILGTLPYMSPEQVLADPALVDSRSDVYALGVLAYELVAHRRPHDFGSTSLPDAIRTIVDDEPVALADLDPRLRGDVATIVDKAMAKERERRYGSAAQLADDIRRYLRDEPITARPPSRTYQLRKFARRNRTLVGGVGAAFVVLLAGTITSTLLFFEKEEQRAASEERGRDLELALRDANANLERALQAEERVREEGDRARFEADTAEAVTDYLVTLFDSASPENPVSGRITALELVDRGVERIRGEFEEQPEIRARLLNAFGRIYNFLQLYDRSRPVLEEALAVTAEVYGEDSAEYADTLERLAHLHLEAEDLAPAERMQRRVLELRQRHLGEKHPLYTDALNNLANTLISKGAYGEAEELFGRAYELRVERLGREHGETAHIMHNLGLLRSYQGRYEESLELLLPAREVLARHYGEANWRALSAHVSIADSLRLLERHGEALEHALAGYEGLRDLFGEDSPMTQRALKILAGCLRDGGDPERAAGILEELLAQETRAGPERAILVHMLACTVHDLERHDEAESLYLDAIDLMERYVPDPQESLESRHNLAVLYQQTDRLEDALPLALAVFEERERILPSDHPDLQGSRTNLARIYRKLGRNEDEAALWH